MAKQYKFGYCKPCLENSGIKRTATWLLPQSTDAGNHIEFIMACDGHHDGWWDGADWDGKALEIPVAKFGKILSMLQGLSMKEAMSLLGHK